MIPQTPREKLFGCVKEAGFDAPITIGREGDDWVIETYLHRTLAVDRVKVGHIVLEGDTICTTTPVRMVIDVEKAVLDHENALTRHFQALREIMETLVG